MTLLGATSTIPALNDAQHAHAQRVHAHIVSELRAAGGWISFERYMELALYAPGLGYYSAGAAKFGPEGDFITAPEISDAFSVVVADQFAEILGEVGGEVLELGAGTGRLAGTVLHHLAQRQCLPERYSILEVSADLLERQRDSVARIAGAVAPRATWISRLPAAMRGVVFANEVLDALPCDRFVVRGGALLRLGVRERDRQFEWAERRADITDPEDAHWLRETSRMLAAIDRSAEGYSGEICLRVRPWIAALAAALQRGVVMLIDYGLPRRQYYLPERRDGTLRCYFRHRAHDDPFHYPGLCDISAWVDFSNVAEAASECGLTVSGFTTQAGFLLAGGIDAALPESATAQQRVAHAHALRQLLLPGEMGEAVKVMFLSKDVEHEWRGLSLTDLRGSL